MRRTILSVGAALALVPASAPALVGAAHVHWARADHAWSTAAGQIDANGDATPDVVVLSGDRFDGYVQCGTGGPFATLNRLQGTLMVPAAKMQALDGRTGDPLWTVEWAPAGTAADPERDRHELLEGVHAGDLDGDGTGDLLVLRSTYAADGSSITQHLTSINPRTGATEWDVARVREGGSLVVQNFLPMAVFGQPGGLLVETEVIVDLETFEVRFESHGSLVRLSPAGAPQTFLELPEELELGVPVPYGDGLRFVRQDAVISIGPPPTITIDVSVHDLTLDEDGEPVVTPAWSKAGIGGSPMAVTGGSDPLVVVAQDLAATETGRVVAFDLDDGAQRWVDPVNVGPRGGTFTTADVNGDGAEDVIASPAFGTEQTGQLGMLLRGGLHAELVALDGKTGAELWRRMDPGGKFRAWSLDFADITGDGKQEIVAALTHADAWPTCSSPADDPGMVAVYDLATGAQRCRLSTDRFPGDIVGVDLNAAPGKELVATTYGGSTYAFTNAQPGCGLLGTGP